MPASYLCNGALAGLVATIPMTLAMEICTAPCPSTSAILYPSGNYEQLTAKAGVREQLEEKEQVELALALFLQGIGGYGLCRTCTEIHALAPSRRNYLRARFMDDQLPRLVTGSRILRPATEHPPRRNALMLTAHDVWGSVLGLLVDRFQEQHYVR
jgi:hypothetical protein